MPPQPPTGLSVKAIAPAVDGAAVDGAAADGAAADGASCPSAGFGFAGSVYHINREGAVTRRRQNGS